ncbi:hypothetical protein D3C84_1198280 [compost metagenome]
MTVLGNFGERYAAAESGHVDVLANLGTNIQRLAAPVGHGLSDALNVTVQQFDLHPADVNAKLSRIYKQHLSGTFGFFLG